jgi:hypothetical protein
MRGWGTDLSFSSPRPHLHTCNHQLFNYFTLSFVPLPRGVEAVPALLLPQTCLALAPSPYIKFCYNNSLQVGAGLPGSSDVGSLFWG